MSSLRMPSAFSGRNKSGNKSNNGTATKRIVSPFSIESHQKNTIVYCPNKFGKSEYPSSLP